MKIVFDGEILNWVLKKKFEEILSAKSISSNNYFLLKNKRCILPNVEHSKHL